MKISIGLDTVFVVLLFAGYAALWRIKRAGDIRRTGVDPEVLRSATGPVQAYFARLVWLMTTTVVAIIALHSLAPATWPPLVRAPWVDSRPLDVVGFALGIAGLGICAAAQATMGSSWRVGIDTEHRTELVTTGLYGRVRNPTYLGLHLMNLGLWLIWPTTLVAAYAVLFFVVMDVQVRAEEEHLTTLHGSQYRSYAGRSWRYVPWVY